MNPTSRYSKLNGSQVPWGYERDKQDPQLLHPIEEQLEILFHDIVPDSFSSQIWSLKTSGKSQTRLPILAYLSR